MKKDNDYQNRLPQHPEPLELPAHTDDTPAAAVPPTIPPTTPDEEVAAAAAAPRTSWGSLTWAALVGLAVILFVGLIYFFAGPTRPLNPRHNQNPVADREVRWGRRAHRGDKFANGKISQEPQAFVVVPAAAVDASSATINQQPINGAAQTQSLTDAVYLFPLNEATIVNSRELSNIAQQAVDNGSYVTITAYTDPSGSASLNQKLSQKRADRVADYMVSKGVRRDHITARGRGETTAFGTPAADRCAQIHLSQSK